MEYWKEVSISRFEQGTLVSLRRRQHSWLVVCFMSGYYQVSILLAVIACARFVCALTDDCRHCHQRSCILSRLWRWIMLATLLPPRLRTKHIVLSLECNNNQHWVCHWRICSLSTLSSASAIATCQSYGCGDGFTDGTLVYEWLCPQWLLFGCTDWISANRSSFRLICCGWTQSFSVWCAPR